MSRQPLPEREGGFIICPRRIAGGHRCRCHHRQRHEAIRSVAASQGAAAAAAAGLCLRHESFAAFSQDVEIAAETIEIGMERAMIWAAS